MNPHTPWSVMRLFPLVLALVASDLSFAGSLNAWGPALGDNTISLMPFTQVDGEGTFGQLYVAGGLGDRADLNVGFGSVVGWNGGTSSTLEFMPRFFVHDSVGIGAHLYYTPGTDGVVVGPEVHGEWSFGALVFAANVGWTPSVTRKGSTPGEVWAVFAPEVYLHPRVSVFFEVDPAVGLQDGSIGATLVPGVGVLFDREGGHSASLGVGVSPGVNPSWSAGVAWTSVWSSKRAVDARLVDLPVEDPPADVLQP